MQADKSIQNRPSQVITVSNASVQLETVTWNDPEIVTMQGRTVTAKRAKNAVNSPRKEVWCRSSRV